MTSGGLEVRPHILGSPCGLMGAASPVSGAREDNGIDRTVVHISFGSISTSTASVDDTSSKPKPKKRQSLCTRGSRTARTPGHAHSKPNLVAGSRAVYALQHQFKTEGSLSSPITTIGGCSQRRATRSHRRPHP